jgi:uncharacterized phage protein (TIGR02220 family)
MHILRTVKNKDYTTINNTIFKDRNISCKSKGFFATIMSLPDNWDFSINGIDKILLEGKSAIYSCIKELELGGYIKRVVVRNELGRIDRTEYYFFETPENKGFSPHSDFPEVDIPEVDNPHVENQPQLNTNNNKVLNEETTKTTSDIGLEKPIDIDWSALVLFFNKETGKNARVVNEKTKKQFRARLKEGYTKDDIVKAIKNCFNDPFHKENPHHLTLEFISRPDKFEKYANYKAKVVRLPEDWYNRELTLEQREMLLPQQLESWKRNKLKTEMEGGKLRPIER